MVPSAEALLPFMCYTHPNGKSSVLELSDVICWESEEHIFMVIFGVSMVAVMCGYWGFLLFLTCVAPAKSKEDDGNFFKTSRFLGNAMLPRPNCPEIPRKDSSSRWVPRVS